MGVYIPSMEMPENCICCDLSHEDGWCPAKQTFTDRYTFETCPLVPVPPHGRLIDADALFEKVYKAWGTEYDAGESNWFMEMINEAPTIIPAKKEG